MQEDFRKAKREAKLRFADWLKADLRRDGGSRQHL